jgi:hypothetical protein
MMNSRLLVSIAVPVTAFALTIAVWLWQQRAAEPTPAIAQRELPQTAPAPRARPALSPPRIEDQRPPEMSAASSAPPPQPNTGDQDPTRIKVPVGFIARARPDASSLTASLVNMTTDELAVTVTAVSAKTHLRSAVDVTLHAHERRNLATDGLELGSGDQVTIQSPPFRDLVVTAQ